MMNNNITIEELEMKLNAYCEFKAINCSVKILDIVGKEEQLVLSITNKYSSRLVIILEVEYVDDTIDLIQRFSSELYKNYINRYTREIILCKEFITRTAGMLWVWIDDDKQDKIDEINLAMMNMHDNIFSLDEERSFYEEFVHMFSQVKLDLESKIA